MGRAVPVLLGAFVAGCVSANVQRLDLDVRPARPPETIEVLEEPPAQPYRVIAHIESKSRDVFHGFDDLRRKLIEEAAVLGGDALILGPEGTDRQPIFLVTGMVMSEERTLEADVIVFDRSVRGDERPGATS
jgi:hypothetical protein